MATNGIEPPSSSHDFPVITEKKAQFFAYFADSPP
jgi:hypothetical protein